MSDLGTALEKAHPAINQEFFSHLHQLLDSIYSLEPNQLEHPRAIPDLGYESPGPLVAQIIYTGYTAGHLDILRSRPYLPDEINFCPVHMPVREKLQQVLENKYPELLF